MKLVAFRSRLSARAGHEYDEVANAMLEEARRMPGFVDLPDYVAEVERTSTFRRED